MVWTAGEFKQELIRDYNTINFRLFNIGVKRQKVDILGEKVIILAIHKRIPSLKHLDENNRFITRMADMAMIDAFKEELKQIIEENYGMSVKSILKDYDPVSECSGTIIIFNENVSEYVTI